MKLVVADDSLLFREGLGRLLLELGFVVAALVGDVDSLLDAVAQYAPDVAIVDIRMPPTFSTEGLQAATQLRAMWPALGVLVLSQFVETFHAMQLLSEDPRGVGYLLKDRVGDLAEFAEAVRRVARGESVVDPLIVSRLVEQEGRRAILAALTPQERQVLTLMAEGRSNQGISERLVVTVRTVESHVRSIFDKLQLPSAADDNRRVLAVLEYLRQT